MGRYRPPTPTGAPYITPAGATALRDELRELWTIERPQVTAAVHEAAKNGDRSENGDYIYGKQRLREIDRRVRYLNLRLGTVKVVDRAPDNIEKIYFGAWVTLLNEEGDPVVYRIVGADEIAMGSEFISIDSPLAKAMLGKTQGQKVEIRANEIRQRYTIAIISYGDLNDASPDDAFTSKFSR